MASREISTSTTMVARYGSIASRFGDTSRPSPSAWNCAMVTKPNSSAPSASHSGFQVENTTSASAIQPRPAAMLSLHIGV